MPIPLHPREASITDDSEQPGFGVAASKIFKSGKCSQDGLLNDILSIFMVAGQPSGKVVRRPEVRRDLLLEAA